MHNLKRISLIIALSLLFIGTVYALEVKKTEFIIKTEPYRNLSITVIDSKTNGELQVFEGRARKFGEFRFTYYGVIKEVLLSGVLINNETGEVVLTKKFGPYTLDTPSITLNFSLDIPEEVESPQEIQDNVTNMGDLSTSEITPPSLDKSSILGLVSGGAGTFSNVYYFVGEGALGAIILIIILRRRITVKTPVEPNPTKVKPEKKTPSKKEVVVPTQKIDNSNKESIDETEKKISELQKQLEQIMNEEKLLKLQRQINQERDELKKLQLKEEPKVQENSNFDENKDSFKI